MKKKVHKSVFIFCVLLLTSLFSLADRPDDRPRASVTTPGSDNNNPNAHPPHTNAPFDLGLGVLLAAGVGYGFKKGYDQKKKNNQSSRS